MATSVRRSCVEGGTAAAAGRQIAAFPSGQYRFGEATCRRLVIPPLRERYLPDSAVSEPPAAGPPVVRFRALGSLDLHREGDGELRALLVQPKRLALFAYLALVNPPHLHRRDLLLALFWPESSDEQARRSLRQALHFLRQTLGPGVLASRGDDEIGIEFAAVWCDVREFERSLDAGHPEEALGLYRGHLLEGFHVTGVAPELGEWLEDERARLRRRAADAAATLAEQAERGGNSALAVQRLRDLLRLEPGAEPALRRLMSLLDRAGDRAGALRSYEEFARRLAAEIETEPSPESVTLAERLRARRQSDSTPGTAGAAAGSAPVVDPPGPAADPVLPARKESPVPSLRAVPRQFRSHRVRWLAAAGLTVAGVLALAMVRRTVESGGRSAPEAAPVLAVGAVEDRTGADSLTSARVLRDLLATDLARLPGVTVVSQTRIQELVVRLASGEETRATLTRAARSAGATEVLEGELYRRARGPLRMDMRRVDAATGVIRRAYTAEGDDLFALVEELSGKVAAELGRRAPVPSLAHLTTTSLVARHLYEEGVRAYYQSDPQVALRLFGAALAEDSTFAMAAYFAARAASSAEPSALLPLAAQAVRMSRRATDPERLLIATQWAEVTNHPSLVPLAESLARRFPLEPEAELALGRARAWSGDFLGAIPHFQQAAERDSLALVEVPQRGGPMQPPCTACEALHNLVYTYSAVDSLAAAERTAREWVRRQPRSPGAWANLAVTLAVRGHAAEALDASRMRGTLLPGGPPDDVFDRVKIALRGGDFATADRLLSERVRDSGPPVRGEALWWQVISYRNQGRLGEALRAARRFRDEVGDADATAAVPQAQVLLELGRAREAVALFDVARRRLEVRVPAGAPDSAPGIRARHHTWYLAHVAAAAAAAGDTAYLARLADSLEMHGARGAYGRDRRLHHHARGLLLLARGEHEAAAAAFRRAIVSPSFGYTRTNLELGRVLMALGRPRESAAVLTPALRGDLQASNYYVTRTEVHEALAQALEAAGERDSARVHHARVANAWRAADPPLRARAAAARARAR